MPFVALLSTASVITTVSNLSDDIDLPPDYVLGHSHRELERLATQARLIDPITRRFFRDAGVVRGMRVLDVGSGAGDVAILAAELVGDSATARTARR